MNNINTDVNFNFSFAPGVNDDQKLGFEIAGDIWSQHLADSYDGKDLEINIYVEVVDDLLPDDVVGSSFPAIKTKNKYNKVYDAIKEDITTDLDQVVADNLLDTKKIDVLVGDKVVKKNSKMHVTTANMKALGLMAGDRAKLDGYILVNNFNDSLWSYDYLGTPPEGTLDFLSMAQHEIGHVLGVISGARYTEETVGKRAKTMTTMDLFRYSKESAELGLNDLSYGREAFFSIDGQESALELTNGEDYQLGHLLTSTNQDRALMGPTISLAERWSITGNDLKVLDAIGWDVVNPGEIDMEAIYKNAQVEVASAHIADRTRHVKKQIFSRDAYNWGRASSGTGWWLEGYFMEMEPSTDAATEEETHDYIHDSDAATEEETHDHVHEPDVATEEETHDHIHESDSDKFWDAVETITDWLQDAQGDLYSNNNNDDND